MIFSSKPELRINPETYMTKDKDKFNVHSGGFVVYSSKDFNEAKKWAEGTNKLTLREKLESNNPIEGVEKWTEGINEFKKIDGVVYKFDEGEGEFRKYEQQNQKRSKQTPYYD